MAITDPGPRHAPSAPSRRLRLLNRVLRSQVKPNGYGSLDPAEALAGRQRFERQTGMTRTPATEVRPVTVAGVPAVWFRRPDSRTDAAILYFHGGDRLAPEHRFPAWLDDALATYEVTAAHLGAERVVVAGDSAGGGLALALLLAARDAGLPQPAGVVTLSPWTDLCGLGDSWRTNAAADPMIDAGWLGDIGRGLTADVGERHPLLSPAFGDFAGCAPVHIQVGSTEVLLDDARAVRDAYERAGVPVDHHEWPEAPHVLASFARWLPEARVAVERIGAFVHHRIP
ncbi:MAG: alpha/beta hydrolase [Acidimicrobiales bacterium]|nr:alpha/beta hydrolase [Acidimicrobiales bacterium]